MKTTKYNDRNFDDLAPKFQRKVYGGQKGDIRLAVLKKDFSEFYNTAIKPADDQPIKILDAGGGYGPFSLKLAQLGHRVTLCDISEKMLDKASTECKARNISDNVDILNCAVQELKDEHMATYDLVLCHAVLEWVHEPEGFLSHLLNFLKTDGLLSLTFYNLNGMIFKNLLRTNYKKIVKEEYAGWPGSLTPPNPLVPSLVLAWLQDKGLEVLCHSGMRVFHDYILDLKERDKDPQTVLDLELKFSREMPFRDLGRYQHIIAKASS